MEEQKKETEEKQNPVEETVSAGNGDAAAEKPSAESAAESNSNASEPEGKKDAKKSVESDWKDRYARLLADFDNFKKRTARDREDTYRFAEADILKDVLPTVDHLALALANAKDKNDEFVKGVQLVYDTLLKSLKEHGAEPFDSVGKVLDPEKMEAIASLPSPEIEEGKVSNEAKRGWMLKEKVLRAAQVVVSSGKPQ